VKVIKIRLDNVFAGQLEELCASLGMSPTVYCELAVMEQTVLVREKLHALMEAKVQEVSPASEEV